ncbi:hypothetical protein OAT84_02710 [Gammaproteobacteria bacterium]|nr:hypothetical protein [Gammaproteobacteria bacterium]
MACSSFTDAKQPSRKYNISLSSTKPGYVIATQKGKGRVAQDQVEYIIPLRDSRPVNAEKEARRRVSTQQSLQDLHPAGEDSEIARVSSNSGVKPNQKAPRVGQQGY